MADGIENIEEKASGVVGLLKLPPYILGALALTSGILLFLPDAIIAKLYMTDFRNNYGFVLGIVFVLSTAILTVLLISELYIGVKRKIDLKKLIKVQTKFLKTIDGDKVLLIKEFLRMQSDNKMLPMQSRVVIELQQHNVISPAGQTHLVNMVDPKINYYLQPWVEQRIKEDEELRKKSYS